MNNIVTLNNMNTHQISTTNHVGYLEVIMGPMFSGKTTTLLELNKQYQYSKMNTCIINYKEDTRYDDTLLSTHDQQQIPCLNLLKLKDIISSRNMVIYRVFLINEGQFFPDLYEVVKILVEKHNKIVHVCGLDGDFKRNAFGQLLQLIPIADQVTKKYAICSVCENGTRALFSKRLTNEQNVKVIGSDNYKPVCRKCYLEHK